VCGDDWLGGGERLAELGQCQLLLGKAGSLENLLALFVEPVGLRRDICEGV